VGLRVSGLKGRSFKLSAQGFGFWVWGLGFGACGVTIKSLVLALDAGAPCLMLVPPFRDAVLPSLEGPDFPFLAAI
jgi:hypothetical protein